MYVVGNSYCSKSEINCCFVAMRPSVLLINCIYTATVNRGQVKSIQVGVFAPRFYLGTLLLGDFIYSVCGGSRMVIKKFRKCRLNDVGEILPRERKDTRNKSCKVKHVSTRRSASVSIWNYQRDGNCLRVQTVRLRTIIICRCFHSRVLLVQTDRRLDVVLRC